MILRRLFYLEQRKSTVDIEIAFLSIEGHIKRLNKGYQPNLEAIVDKVRKARINTAIANDDFIRKAMRLITY